MRRPAYISVVALVGIIAAVYALHVEAKLEEAKPEPAAVSGSTGFSSAASGDPFSLKPKPEGEYEVVGTATVQPPTYAVSGGSIFPSTAP